MDLRLTLTFRMGHEVEGKHLSSSAKGNAVWRGGLKRMEHCQIKQKLDCVHVCDELAGDLFCCSYRLHHTLTLTRHTLMDVCCYG